VTRPIVIDGWRIDVSVRPGVSRLLSAGEVSRVVAAALGAAGAPKRASISVILTNDEELEALNVAHLGHEGPTDVLSFPLLPPDAFPAHEGATRAAKDHGSIRPFALPPRARLHLGDIVISVARAIDQATHGRGGHDGDRRWAPADELRLLLTHGTLHLCGWDHAEPVEEAAMRALEGRLLGDVPD
jgi:probable rRNA maturation factor